VIGFDPTVDRFRCEPASIMDSIEFAANALLRNEHAIETLPMLSLYQYLAREVCYMPSHVCVFDMFCGHKTYMHICVCIDTKAHIHTCTYVQVLKDASAYANACTLKARACAMAGFIAESVDLLLDVYAGRGLPDVIPVERPPAGQQASSIWLMNRFAFLCTEQHFCALVTSMRWSME